MRRGDKGVVLIVVLWILTILSLIAIGLAHTVRLQMKIARFNLDQTEALTLASSGIERAIARLKNNSSNNSFEEEVMLGHGKISLKVVDEEGRLNINFANEQILEALPGIDDRISDAILDWIDKDDLHRLNGAEDSYYQGLDPGYNCKNGPFDTAQELLLVKGVTSEVLYGEDDNRNGFMDPGEDENGDGMLNRGIIDMITTNTSGKININTASKEVLEAFFGKSKIADQITTYRPFKDMEELVEKLPQIKELLDKLTITSSSFRIESTGISNRAIKRITAIVDKGELPIKIKYWREG